MTTHDHDPERLERSLRAWMTDERPPLVDRDARIDEVLGSLDDTPQTRARFLGRWLNRGGGARRGADVHDHPPITIRRNRLMLSATGITAAFAILALAVSATVTNQLPPNATGSTFLVGSGLAAEYSTIQDAVDAAADGDTIELEPGEYVESIVIDKDVSIVGDTTDPSRVVITIPPDGPQVKMWNHRTNYAFELLDAEASVGGLTIKGPGLRTTAFVILGGQPTIHDVDVQLAPLQTWPRAFATIDERARGEIRDSSANAYVEMSGGSFLTLSGNSTTGQDATNGFTIYASGELSEVEVRDNRVNGVVISDGAHGSVRDNEIVAADGCGIDITGANTEGVAMGNVVRASRSGICTSGRAAATIEGNEVSGNGTGISLGSDDVTVTSNDIRANDVGLLVRVGAPNVVGNTIEENRAGLALGTLPASPALSDNRICGNEVDVEVPEGVDTPSLEGNESC